MVASRRKKLLPRGKSRRMKGGNTPTFHVVIATAGRVSLMKMLDSLKPQLTENDALTLIFDGQYAKKKSTYTDEYGKGMKCKVHVIEQIPGLKAYGHASINKYLPDLQTITTYVMFADDDDHYLEGAFDVLRKKCLDSEILYIAKVRDKSLIIPPFGHTTIDLGYISKQCGIIPFKDKNKSKLGETGYTGDFDYYKDLKDKVKGLIFLDDIIYEITPEVNANGDVKGGGISHMRNKITNRRRKRSKRIIRQVGASTDPIEDIGFIISRCVKTKEHNFLYKECYNAIRKYHPNVKIVFIDDNTDKAILENYPMTNVEIIQSEYPGAGEYLPYYYLLQRKLFKKAVLMQDSMILQTEIPFDTVGSYKFLFYYTPADMDKPPNYLIEKTKVPNELLSVYTDRKWVGCWGSSIIITYDFLKKIEDEVGILCWKDLINNRDMRISLETAIALVCIYLNNDKPPEMNSLCGHVYQLQVMREYQLKNGNKFSITDYMRDKDKIKDKIIKIFNAR